MPSYSLSPNNAVSTRHNNMRVVKRQYQAVGIRIIISRCETQGCSLVRHEAQHASKRIAAAFIAVTTLRRLSRQGHQPTCTCEDVSKYV